MAFVKDPSAVLDYTVDWSDWLPTGDTISSHTVTAATGLTVASSADTDTTVVIWLSGGTAGSDYEVTCQIVTTGGRTEERTFIVRVRQQ